MQCSPCGARYEVPSARCPECGALQEASAIEAIVSLEPVPVVVQEPPSPKPGRTLKPRKSTPSLLEFPGVTKTTLPEWRRELGERVRERRARDGGSESCAVFSEAPATATATLELLPQIESPEINPLVVAALRRIERARTQTPGNSAAAMAYAYEEQPQLAPAQEIAEAEVPPEAPKPERVHNLAVVPPPEIETPQEIRKPIRVIGDQNDPALNYLDSIPTSVTLETRGQQAAPILLRVPGALVDMGVATIFSLPFLGLTEWTTLAWANPRVIGFVIGTFLLTTFIYLTVSVAFTGHTVGMRLFSLRVVDARTGLIPTGGQSASRAFVYILSLASAGILLLFTLIDREKHAPHDRFARTAVVRA